MDMTLAQSPASICGITVGFVVQEPFLFSRTVADNIAMAQPDATEDEIRAAAEMASVDQDIQAFRDGYGTVVGERGMTVSGDNGNGSPLHRR